MNKILIAEDELTSRKTIVSAVIGTGNLPIECSNGRLALEVLLDNPDTALLITDISMPELDGRGLIKAIRNESRLSHLPIIILSGAVKLSGIDDLLSLGASRFLPKPFGIDELKGYIKLLAEKTKDQNGHISKTDQIPSQENTLRP